MTSLWHHVIVEHFSIDPLSFGLSLIEMTVSFGSKVILGGSLVTTPPCWLTVPISRPESCSVSSKRISEFSVIVRQALVCPARSRKEPVGST